MIENRKYLGSTSISCSGDGFTSVEGINDAIQEGLEQILNAKESSYPRVNHEYEWELSVASDDNFGYLELDVYRTETVKEVEERLAAIKAKEEKAAQDIKDAEVKKTRLQLAQDDPDWYQYKKLKEKFKDLD